MFTKTTLTALTAAAALAPGAASAAIVPAGPTQSFVYSEVVAQADVSTPDFVRVAVGLNENANATDSQGLNGFTGAIANLHSLFLDDVLHLAGTSNDVNVDSTAAQAFYHEVRTTIDAVSTTIYSLYVADDVTDSCLLYTSPSPRDLSTSRMPSSA